MGRRLREFDWTSSSLGPPDTWPQPLRIVVRVMLNTGHPAYIFWGPDNACLYNDAYSLSIGPEMHPGSLGQPARQVWDEIWTIIGPQIEQVRCGKGATWHVDHLVPITRNGRREDVYWTYSYSPIDDALSPYGIGGVLVLCSETTKQVLSARDTAIERDWLAKLFEQAPSFMAILRGTEHRFEIANPGYMRLVGHRPVLGRTVAEALPEVVDQGYLALLDQVFETGIPYSTSSAKYTVEAFPGASATESYLDFVYQPIFDSQGRVEGIFVEGFDVTEKHHAQQALRRSQAHLKEGLAAARMATWDMAIESEAVEFSGNAADILDVDPIALRDPWPLFNVDDVREFRASRDRARTSLEPFALTMRFYRARTGEAGWVEMYGKLHTDSFNQVSAFSGIMLDVTMHKRTQTYLNEGEKARAEAEQRAREAGERLSLTIDAAALGTFYCPMPLDKIFWNNTCKAHFFLDEDAEIDFDLFYSLIHHDDRECTRQAVEAAVFGGKDYDVEFRTVAPDGRNRWIRAKGRCYFGTDGVPVRFDGITIDITRHKQEEASLLAANHKKDHFLAMLAHELRNPLAPISAAASLLTLPGTDRAKVQRTGEIIARQVKHMGELLDDLLDVSRVTRGMVQLKKGVVDMKSVLSAACEQAQPLMETRRHRMEIRLTSETATALGDEKRLVQVIVNLLTNAAKYTPEGGVIEMGLAGSAANLDVTVRDNGVGMPPALLESVFDLFVQAERSPDRHQGGLGLGLALVKTLVELHGGKVYAESDGPGKGSIFTVRLPRYHLEADFPLDARTTEAAPISLPRKIMIVDDNADAAIAIAMLLEAMGHQVHVENDPHVALDKALAIVPEIFLLDIGMPGMDGNELARRLKATATLQNAVLVAVSGYAQDKDREDTHAAGFDYHFAKPLEVTQLVSITANYLKRR